MGEAGNEERKRVFGIHPEDPFSERQRGGSAALHDRAIVADDPEDVLGSVIDRSHLVDSAGRFRRRNAGVARCDPAKDGLAAGFALFRGTGMVCRRITVLRFGVNNAQHRALNDLAACQAEIPRGDQTQRKQDGQLLHTTSLSRFVVKRALPTVPTNVRSPTVAKYK